MSIWFKDYSDMNLEDVSIGIDKTLGIKYLELGDNFLKAKMPVSEHTKQPLGLLHGGASCVLAESVASFAAFLCINPEKKSVVGLNLNANHLKSIKDGFVYATAEPIHIGNSTSVWNVEIENENQELVSIVKFTAMHKDITK
jgi:1,4-dihydroxy-2-naphthoyl-CoA hydrolase